MASRYSEYRTSFIFCQLANVGIAMMVRHYLGATLLPSPSIVQAVKSICSPQPLQVCGRSNSSEKTSFSTPHLWHLHINAFRFLKSAYPGQCWGVVSLFAMVSSLMIVSDI
jgi:hypothetical protein